MVFGISCNWLRINAVIVCKYCMDNWLKKRKKINQELVKEVCERMLPGSECVFYNML